MTPDAALLSVGAELGLPITAVQCDSLLAYMALLQRWNATYNLTAVRDPAQMLTQHLADCLAVVAPLQRELAAVGRHAAATVLDVGSGGGLPGVVLAIMNPAWVVTCVDTVGKKAAFVQQVAAELRLPNLRAMHRRVEQLRDDSFDVIASRAFASLADFTSLTHHLLAPHGVWMAMKGKSPEAELTALPANVEAIRVDPLIVPGLHAERCLVWLRAAA